MLIRELDQEAVPEWRAKYLDYKHGKKKVKAIAMAATLHSVNKTPQDLRQYQHQVNDSSKYLGSLSVPLRTVGVPLGSPSPKLSRSVVIEEELRLISSAGDSGDYSNIIYDIIAPKLLSDPTRPPPPALKLPNPAMGDSSRICQRSNSILPPTINYEAHPRNALPTPNGTHSPSQAHNLLPSRHASATNSCPLSKHIFSGIQPSNTPSNSLDIRHIALSAYEPLQFGQAGFFDWLDQELAMVETFYKMKENEASKKLDKLRAQLYEMTDRGLQEVLTAQMALGAVSEIFGSHSDKSTDSPKHVGMWPDTSKVAFRDQHHSADSRGGFFNRTNNGDRIDYRRAKTKLKFALEEFYRDLQLLESYASLNYTAFRKINKKFDKAVGAHNSLRYMFEKVNKAYFAQSKVLNSHMQDVEDLYARHVKHGNRKKTLDKLRNRTRRPGNYTGSVLRCGLLLGIGIGFAVQGVTYGMQLQSHSDLTIQIKTSYLLQIYGGYFLGLCLLLLFCLNCGVWATHKINYVFVFEFDRYGTARIFLYYPIILVGVTALIMSFPAPILYHHSRMYFLYSHWRLLFSGFYPVEFRDFFLGDMYCSLTYVTMNLQVFFCLYSMNWDNPNSCSSSHSRLQGFFSTLPGIWRMFQCFRRYYDTRNIFPHLANCGKYTFTILHYMALSMYRIDGNRTKLIVFITFALCNTFYSVFWDLAMDWSVCQPNAQNPCLRQILGYKGPWKYYCAMISNVIFRFSWVLYTLHAHNLQHASILSFLIGFIEVTRRGIWMLFRVENEHCANVSRLRTSRDIALPYNLESSPAHAAEHNKQHATLGDIRYCSAKTGQIPQPVPLIHPDCAAADARMSRIGKLIPTAHEQDFERKRSRLDDRDTLDNMDGWGDDDHGDTQNVVEIEKSWYIHG
ncbi:EXS domain containing protein [Hyaloscypha variabilis]